MKIMGSPIRILESPMKRQVGSPMKWVLRKGSSDDDFFPDSFHIGCIIINQKSRCIRDLKRCFRYKVFFTIEWDLRFLL